MFAYSSINHLGYCILGIVAVTGSTGAEASQVSAKAAALTGVMLQLFSHAITAAALFWFVALLARRSGGVTGLNDFGGLRRAMPVFSGLMGITLFASLGLPGLIGFPGEFLIFKGVFPLDWWAAALALLGLLMTAVFLLTIVQRVFSGPLPERWAAYAGPNRGRTMHARSPDRRDVRCGALSPGDQRDGAWSGNAVCRPGEVLSMLAWTIYLSFIGAVAVTLTPARSPVVARLTALLTTIAGLGIAIAARSAATAQGS